MKEYFKPKQFEILGNRTVYEYIGIKYFKKYLIRDGDLIRNWRKVKQIKLERNGRIQALETVEKQTRKYEAIHLIFLLLTMLIMVINYRHLSVSQLVMINLINLYANIYPIFLQRYNRIRIMRILDIIRKTNSNKGQD